MSPNIDDYMKSELEKAKRMAEEYTEKNKSNTGNLFENSLGVDNTQSESSFFNTTTFGLMGDYYNAKDDEERKNIEEKIDAENEKLKREYKKWESEHPEEAKRSEEERLERNRQREAEREERVRQEREQELADRNAKKEQDALNHRDRLNKIHEDAEKHRADMKEQAKAREAKRQEEREKDKETSEKSEKPHIVQRQSTVKICGTCQHWNGTRKPSNVSRIWAEFDENEKSMCYNALGGRQMKKGSDRCQKWVKWSNIK